MTGPAINHSAFVLSLFDTGLETARLLRECGIPTLGFDYNTRQPGFKSHEIRAIFTPEPLRHEDDWVECIIGHAKVLPRKPVLFPASDLFAFLVSKRRKDLSPYCHFLLPEHPLMERIIDKSKQFLLAEEAGIEFPRTFIFDDSVDVNRLAGEVSLPVFVKPTHGYLWQKCFHTKGIKAETADELVQALQLVRSKGLSVVIQEIIPGPVTNNFEVSVYLDKSGSCRAFFVMQKLRQFPAQFGVGTFGRSVYFPELRPLTLQLLSKFGFKGFANLEFKKDPRDGRFKFIEVNPRVWQQVSLAKACGVNFPMLQYLDLTGQKLPDASESTQEGVSWIDPVRDLQSVLSPGSKLTIQDWLNSIRESQVLGIWRRQDPRPFLHAAGYGRQLMAIFRDFWRSK